MGKTILLVDDNENLRTTVKYLLDEMGYNTVLANDGKDCIKKLKDLAKTKTPDLILLDIMMPSMDGWDTAAEIKKNLEWKDIPIIFLTAVDNPSGETFGKIIGDDYIEKPFDIDDLKQKISKILKR